MKRAKSLVLFYLLLISFSSSAQNTDAEWGVDISLGGAIPLHPPTRTTFNLGLTTSIGVVVPRLHFDRLKIMPVLGMKWYFKEIAEINSVTEHLRTWKAGIQAEYAAAEIKNIIVSPVLRIDHNWSRNYFSETYYYDPWTNISSGATSDYYLKGTGFSGDLGLKLSFKKFHLQLHYEFYQPDMKVNPLFVKQAAEQGLIIPASQQFKFSSINLSFGSTLNF